MISEIEIVKIINSVLDNKLTFILMSCEMNFQRDRKFSELYVVSTAGVDGFRKQLSCSKQLEYFMSLSKSFIARHMTHSGRSISNSIKEMVTIWKLIKRLCRIMFYYF